MKNFKYFVFTLLVSVSLCTVSSAQIVSSVCQSLSPVGSACVGACGNPGEIDYTLTLCSSKIVRLCVVNDQTSLCPTHRAIAHVFVNGVFAAAGDITALGSSVSFTAQCGSVIKVKTYAVQNWWTNPGTTACVWLGEVDFSLRR